MNKDVLDTRRWDEARGGCLQIRRGGGGGFDTETAKESERFFYVIVRRAVFSGWEQGTVPV